MKRKRDAAGPGSAETAPNSRSEEKGSNDILQAHAKKTKRNYCSVQIYAIIKYELFVTVGYVSGSDSSYKHLKNEIEFPLTLKFYINISCIARLLLYMMLALPHLERRKKVCPRSVKFPFETVWRCWRSGKV